MEEQPTRGERREEKRRKRRKMRMSGRSVRTLQEIIRRRAERLRRKKDDSAVNMALYLSEEDVNDLLTMDLALEAVENGFKLLASGDATNSPRSRIGLESGSFNFMAAASPELGVMGTKTYGAIGPGGAKFYVQLYDTADGGLLAMIEASDMGQIRTGAASGVATKHMARRDAATVGIVGTGYQARTQLEAVCRVRDVKSVMAFSRTPERRQQFAEWASDDLGVETAAAGSARECVEGSDIVIAITSTAAPVVSGEWLTPGTHVNAAGANHRRRRELDSEAVTRAAVIVADDVEQARIECGDLIQPIEQGLLSWQQVHDLSDVVAGTVQGRTGDEDITLFESQGMALEDIAVGSLVYRLASERGIGRELPA